MLEVHTTNKFEKDYLLMRKRGFNMKLLQDIVFTLQLPEKLPAKNREHKLKGDYAEYKECHILPDWLLIYQQTATDLVLVRTESHSDLF